MKLLIRSRPLLLFSLVLINLLSLSFFGGCKEDSANIVENILVDNQAVQPGELLKIDNYPLFVMSYNEDYGFSDYLKTGLRSSKVSSSNIINNSSEWGCTCFAVMGNSTNIIMGRNFDFYHHVAMVLYTKPAKAYASLSTVDLHYLGFNENSTVSQILNSSTKNELPYYPFDGLNEKGVSIGMMAIPYAQPPNDPSKVNLGCLQIIRLVLDYAASVEEAVALIKNYNYIVENPPIHFLIADKSGKSVVVEFVNSEVKVIPDSEAFHVCTNFIISGSNAPSSTNCWRYNTAYKELKNVSGKMDDAASMNLLQSVSQNITMWSSVFNMSKNSMSICPGRNFNKSYSITIP